jgi:hypothetical protein
MERFVSAPFPVPDLNVDDPTREAGNDFGEECTAPAAPEKPNPYRQTPGQALAKIGRLGAAIPLDELPTFNTLSEGGLRSGEAIALAGPSGVGKTGLGVMYSKKSVELGRPTASYWVDQSPGAATVRLGQLFGLERRRLEDPKKFPEGLVEIDRLVAAQPAPLFFTDVDADDVNVTANALDLRLVAKGRESTLIVDSLNLAPVAKSDADEERLRIRDTALAIAGERKRYDMAVVVTCETNRTAGPLAIYGPGLLDLEFRVDLIATVAESRAIGHAFDRLVVMFGDPERLVRAFLVKNRRGKKGSWWMRMDAASSAWSEVPPDEAEAQLREDGEAKTAGKVARDAPVVLDFLKRMRVEGKGSQSTNEICRGTNLSWRHVEPALETLKGKAIYIDTTTKKKGTKSSWAVFDK